MDIYALVIDISSDEEEQRTMARQSTPNKVAPVNVITTLDLSGSSLEATKGSAEELMNPPSMNLTYQIYLPQRLRQ